MRLGQADPVPDRRAVHPEIQEGFLVPIVPRASPHTRYGAVGVNSGNLCARHLGTLGRRAGQALGMSRISKRQVSRLCEKIGGKVKDFLELAGRR